jgi:hypothetical protein
MTVYDIECMLSDGRGSLTPCMVSVPPDALLPGSAIAKSIFEHVRAEGGLRDAHVEVDLRRQTATVFSSSVPSGGRVYARCTVRERMPS